MSAPKKFKSALKKLCDRAKSALNSQVRISSPDVILPSQHGSSYLIQTFGYVTAVKTSQSSCLFRTVTNINKIKNKL